MEKADQILLEEQNRLSMLPTAAQIAIDRGEVTCFTFQRFFSVGYTCSMRLMDLLEERKIVGPRNNNGKHEVLIGWDEFAVMFGPRDDFYSWQSCTKDDEEQDGNSCV